MISKFTSMISRVFSRDKKTEPPVAGLQIGHFEEGPEGAKGLRDYLSQTVFK